MSTKKWYFPFDISDTWNPTGVYEDDKIFGTMSEESRRMLRYDDDRERKGQVAMPLTTRNKRDMKSALEEAELQNQLDTLKKFYIYKTLKGEEGEGVLFDYDEELPEIISRDTYNLYNQSWEDRKLNNDLQDKLREMVMEEEFDDYLEFIRRNSKWERDIDIHINRAEDVGKGFRRKRKTRKMRRRRRQVGNRRRSRVKRQSRKNLNKKLRRSRARHNSRRTRSAARRSRARKNLR